MMDELKRVTLESVAACEEQRVTDWTAIKNRVKSNLSGYLYKTTRRSPMILPAHFRDIMNIQIYGKAKCFDTKKAERYFKERRIKYQFIDVIKYGMSRGELNSVKNAVGLDAMVNTDDEDYPLYQYLASNDAKLEKLYEVPYLIKTPIVRNGRQATVGYCPEVWKGWE